MTERIIQTDTLQGIANALRGGASQSASDKIDVTDFGTVAAGLKADSNTLKGVIERTATSVTIPEGVTSIGVGAFNGCSSLTTVNLPSTLTSIGAGAFNGCSSLEEITIPEGVTSIGVGAFYECTSLAVINCGFSEGAVSGAPWGAPETVTINYDVTPQA